MIGVQQATNDSSAEAVSIERATVCRSIYGLVCGRAFGHGSDRRPECHRAALAKALSGRELADSARPPISLSQPCAFIVQNGSRMLTEFSAFALRERA